MKTALIFNHSGQNSLDIRMDGSNIIQQFAFNGGQSQRWQIQEAGLGPNVNGVNVPRFYILSILSGQAVTAGSSGSIIQAAQDPSPIFAHDFGQLWELEQLPQRSSLDVRLYRIRSTRDGLVLGLNPNGTTAILLAPDAGLASQQWEILYKFEPGYTINRTVRTINNPVAIFNVLSQKCLDVPLPSSSSAQDIQQYTYNGGRNQFWAIDPIFISPNAVNGQSSTPTAIRPLHVPGMALDLKDPIGTSGAPLADRMNVIQRSRSGVNTQGWIFIPIYQFVGSDKPLIFDNFLISNSFSPYNMFYNDNGPALEFGLVLDVVWGSLIDHGFIQVHRPHRGLNQRWEIWVSEPY
jgi:Ricin-type beta-trefoil lectin domain-like